MAAPGKRPRERMVFSAAQLIRRDGVTATSMRDVVEHARAPRGSLQHYFPDGKQQLINEAVEWAGRYAGSRIERFLAGMRRPSPGRLFAAMVQQWVDDLAANDFEAGCPVAAATVDCADSVESTRTAARAAFAAWRAPIADALRDMGVPPRRTASVATLMVSALEGAIVIARAEHDLRALHVVARELGPMLDALVDTPG
jgi:AcrR family transcriptional regulator